MWRIFVHVQSRTSCTNIATTLTLSNAFCSRRCVVRFSGHGLWRARVASLYVQPPHLYKAPVCLVSKLDYRFRCYTFGADSDSLCRALVYHHLILMGRPRLLSARWWRHAGLSLRPGLSVGCIEMVSRVVSIEVIQSVQYRNGQLRNVNTQYTWCIVDLETW